MGACGSSLPVVSMQLDNPTAASDAEKTITDLFQSTITDEITKNGIREKFQNYKDKSAFITAAITDSKDEEKKELAKDECYQNVTFCNYLVDLAKKNGECVKRMYDFIYQNNEGGLIQTIEQYPLTAKCLVEAINFALDFDAIKLTLFKINGDISYYRRCLKPDDIDAFSQVGETGMFFGYPAPFINAVFGNLDTKNDCDRVMNFFGSYCDIFTSLVDSDIIVNEEMKKMLVHAIGGLLIIIDSVAPTGAFAKVKFFSNVDAARVISTYTPKQSAVIAAVVYNSQNFSKPTTLPKITEYLNI